MAVLTYEDVGAYLAIGFGAWAFVIAAYLALKVSGMRRWHSAGGTVTRSGVKRTWRWWAGTDGVEVWGGFKPDVAYEYQVDGRIYSGSRIGYARWVTNMPSVAKKTADRYPLGGPVEVWYDPEKPGRCALDRRVSPWAFVAVLLGGAACITCGVLALQHVI